MQHLESVFNMHLAKADNNQRGEPERPESADEAK
jgi:hypothetical protein